MRIQNSLAGFAKVAMFLVLTLAFAVVSPVSAYTVTGPIRDGFNQLYLKPDNRAQWWLINWGPDNGSQGIWEDYCGSASCIQAMRDANEKFARMSVYPQEEEGFFTNAEIAELHTGFPEEDSERWLPTVDHPVVMETRVRFSDDYHVDGSGAMGTAGIWMWHSPYEIDRYNPTAPNNAFGFNFATASTYGGSFGGFFLNVVRNNLPVFFIPVPVTDMTQWMEFKYVWSVDANGVQYVDFMLNGQSLGVATITDPLPALSMEAWVDNESFQFTGIDYQTFTSEQYMDVDYINIYQVE